MKKHINLLLKKNEYQKTTRLFEYFRLLTLIFGLACVAVALLILILKEQIKNQYDSLLSQKEQYLTELLPKKEIEKKIIYFNEKSTALSTNAKEDMNLLPYYTLFSKYFPISSSSSSANIAKVDHINFDNQKVSDISLNFSSYNSFYDGLKTIEDPSFLANFDGFVLDSFSYSPQSESYTLAFKATFKNLSQLFDQ